VYCLTLRNIVWLLNLTSIYEDIHRFISFWFSHQNLIVCIYVISNSCYMPLPSCSPLRELSNYTWRRIEAVKLLVLQFPPTSYHLIPQFTYRSGALHTTHVQSYERRVQSSLWSLDFYPASDIRHYIMLWQWLPSCRLFCRRMGNYPVSGRRCSGLDRNLPCMHISGRDLWQPPPFPCSYLLIHYTLITEITDSSIK
jgi:hypothetical protein